jgi:hypothetical protein
VKLFVCGESSGDPETWSIWSEWSLVIAETKEQALEMTGETRAAEVPMDKAMLICKMGEPNWGDDL